MGARPAFSVTHIGGVMKPSRCESCAFHPQKGDPSETHTLLVPATGGVHQKSMFVALTRRTSSPLLFTNWYCEESITSIKFK